MKNKTVLTTILTMIMIFVFAYPALAQDGTNEAYGSVDPVNNIQDGSPLFTYWAAGQKIIRRSELGPLTLPLEVPRPAPLPGRDFSAIYGIDELGMVRAVTAQYHTIAIAQADNFDLVPGLDYCFDNPGVGGMGYHYINTDLLDTTIDPLRPEALVYAPLPNEKLQLAAVEYIVPAEAWDAAYSQPPKLYDLVFGLEPALGVYELHVWIWKNNPSGIFFEWNPDVVCR